MFLLLACLSVTPVNAQSEAYEPGGPRPQTEKALPGGHASPTHGEPVLGVGSGTTNLVQLLDLDLAKGKAALKVIFTSDGMEASLDCGYAGMKEFPTSGVTLALLDLSSGSVEEFPVYPLAATPDGCAPPKTSEATLAAAKKAISEAGLDITKKPAPVSPDSGGRFEFAGYEPIVAWQHDVSGEDEDEWKKLVDPEPDFSMGAALSGLRVGPTVLVSTKVLYSRNMAGMGGTNYALGWQDGSRAVFLVERWYADMRSGYSGSWGLTRAIDLNPAE